ncbi:MAG: Helix-turn-helix domain [Mycobacterium sp.]|jgi:excisionase family DNA binding protein|nr:Helix-turn-helix domain [Mycobacterium sp.]
MWTVPQTAAYLGISEVAVRKAITRRELRAIRVGKFYRIDPADIEAYTALPSLDVSTEAVAR